MDNFRTFFHTGLSLPASVHWLPALLFLVALCTATLVACGDSAEQPSNEGVTAGTPKPSPDGQMERGAELTVEEYAEAMEKITAAREEEIEGAAEGVLSGSLFSSEAVVRLSALEINESWSQDDVAFANNFAETMLQAATGLYRTFIEITGESLDEMSGLEPPAHLVALHGDLILTYREILQLTQDFVEAVQAIDTKIGDREELAGFMEAVDSLGSGPSDPELEERSETVCLELERQLETELERDVDICNAGESGATAEGADTVPAPTAVPAVPEPTATSASGPAATAVPAPTVTAAPEPTATAVPVPTATPTPTPVEVSNEADREALLALYHATDGPEWDNNDNWLSDRPLGEWYGVTTDRTGRVTRLDLSENELSGEIPPELGNLANLESLRLYNNQLSGEIPPELGNLASLEYLSLYQTQLTGEIPAEMGNLTNLEWLKLSSSELTGEIPAELGNLVNLEWLRLSGNELNGEIPSELGNLVNLEILELNKNELSGEIPSALGNLVNLRTLTFTSNELSGEIPAELGNLANLEWLRLSSNELSGQIPGELGSLANLRSLELLMNRLSGEIPVELGNLASLQFLFLNFNRLSGGIPSELGDLASLETMLLNHNQLSGEIPSELGDLASLERLDLSRNRLSGCVPSELRDARISTDDLEFC